MYLLPGPVLKKLAGAGSARLEELLQAKYTSVWLLRDYGMPVTETTSVPISIVGHFWMFGGYGPVLIGGFLMALLHGFVAWRIRRAWLWNPDKGIFYFGTFWATIMWSFNNDLITNWRDAIWHLIFAYCGFKLISPILRICYAGKAEQHEERALDGHAT